MATEDQVCFGAVLQVFRKVLRQSYQYLLLAWQQAAAEICRAGLSGLEINAVQIEPGFQFLNFRRGSWRRRRWRRSFHVYHGRGRSGKGRIAVIPYVACNCDTPGFRAAGVQCGSVAVAGDVTSAW